MQPEEVDSWSKAHSRYYEQHRHAGYQANGPLPAPDGNEPDDYYRQGSFFPPTSPPQPNIVVNGVMATVSNRPDPPHRVPSAAKSPSPGLKSARQNLRSVSGPASSLPISNGGRPAAVSSNSYRPPVRNIVSKFNQPPGPTESPSVTKLRKPAPPIRSATHHGGSPASSTASIEPVREGDTGQTHNEQLRGSNGLNGAAGSRNVLRRGGNPSQTPERHGRRHAKSSVSDLNSGYGGSRRPLLFGELPGNVLSPELLGHGILETARHRSGSLDGSVQRPTALFSHGRSQTTSAVPMLATPGRGRSASVLGHRKSRSDLSGLHLSPTSEAQFDANGIDDYFSQIQASTRGAHSKIPLPSSSRRPSTTSESASSIQSSRASSALSESRYQPKTPSGDRNTNKKKSGKDSTPRARPVTPTSTRRYATPPSKRPEQSPKVSVQVKVPPPTTSPVLRSSRPRQPVSAASTAASRAKMAERLKNPPSTSGSVAEKMAARRTPQKPKPRRDLGLAGPSIADRKALIEKSMRAQGIHAHRNASRARAQPGSRGVSPASDTREGKTAELQDGIDSIIAKEGDPHKHSHGQKLSVDIKDLPSSAEPPLKLAVTSMESEESPVLGALAPAFSPQLELGSASKPESQRDSRLNDEEAETEANDPRRAIDGVTSVDKNVLDQVLQMRQSVCSSASQTDNAESEKDDSGSINIMLGATPSLEQSQQLWGQSQGSQDPSIRWSATSYASSTRGIQFVDEAAEKHDSYPYGPYSSVVPDDSISMAMANQHHDPRSADWTPQIHHLPMNGRYSRDQSEGTGTSTILKILDYYRSSNPVTPEVVQGFQQQIKAVSPYIKYDEWTSREKTEQFLASLVKESPSLASPDDTPKQPSRTYVGDDFLDEYERRLAPEGDLGGTAIIYSNTELYGKPSRPASTKGSEKEDRPAPPPKDWRYSPHQAGQRTPLSNTGPTTPLEAVSRLTSPFRPNLPEVRSAAEGLGLAIQSQTTPNVSLEPGQNSVSPSPSNHADATAGASSSPPTPSTFRKPIRESTLSGNTEVGATRPNSTAEDISVTVQQPADEEPNDKPSEQDPDQLKKLNYRRNTVKELLETELYYFQDMKVVEDIYKGTSYAIHEVSDDDRKVLFGNTADLVAFSLNFLDALRPAAEPIFKLNQAGRWNKRNSISTNNTTATVEPIETPGPPDAGLDRKTTIGSAFLDHLSEMERVYCAYVQNHSSANKRLEDMQKNKQVQIWLNECHNYAGDITTAWSLDALIVKPTQRFLKYAILLDQLIGATPTDHPDYGNLKTAVEGMRALSARINETKGRKEIVEKIITRKREKSDAGIGAAVQKAFGRRAEKVKQQVGLSETVDDPEYDAISQKFGGHFFQLQIVMRDVEKYLEDVDRMIHQNNSLATELENWLDVSFPEHPEIESKWRQYMVVIREITAYALGAHVSI